MIKYVNIDAYQRDLRSAAETVTKNAEICLNEIMYMCHCAYLGYEDKALEYAKMCEASSRKLLQSAMALKQAKKDELEISRRSRLRVVK